MCCPVVLVKSGVGQIQVVHVDGQAKVKMGLSKPTIYPIVITQQARMDKPGLLIVCLWSN